MHCLFQNLLNADHMRAELLHCAGQTPKNRANRFFWFEAGVLLWRRGFFHGTMKWSLALLGICNKFLIKLHQVLNCLPSPSQRGQMLQLIREHLKIGGHAFIMVFTHFQTRARPPDDPLTFYLQIPRRCLECSPLFNFEIFSEILLALQLKARDKCVWNHWN